MGIYSLWGCYPALQARLTPTPPTGCRQPSPWGARGWRGEEALLEKTHRSSSHRLARGEGFAAGMWFPRLHSQHQVCHCWWIFGWDLVCCFQWNIKWSDKNDLYNKAKGSTFHYWFILTTHKHLNVWWRRNKNKVFKWTQTIYLYKLRLCKNQSHKCDTHKTSRVIALPHQTQFP